MGVFPKRGRQNLKVFNQTRIKKNEIFGIDNDEDKIIFDKIWWYQNKVIYLKRGRLD